MKFTSAYYVFSAPSGGGKTTIVNKLVQKYSELAISISATTRPKRSYEVDGREYLFLSRSDFMQAITDGKFLEYEEVHGAYYGTLKETVQNMLKSGKTVLFDIDVNGATSIKENYSEAVLFFIKPPSQNELINRLKKRKSETETSIQKRLTRLEYEYAQADKFDYIILNDDLEKAIEKIEDIILT